MTIELGFDYSCFVQPAIQPPLAERLAAAGIKRCGLAMDASDDTFTTALALSSAGIALDGYRELSGPSTYPQQVQSALAGFERLAKANVYCRILWLTAEDLTVGSTPYPLLMAQHSKMPPAVAAVRHRIDNRRIVAMATAPANAPTANPGLLVPAMHAAVEAAKGLRVGIYTGGWFWPTYMGNTTDFAELPLWHAGYDGQAALGAVNYGGWTIPFAHQYASPVVITQGMVGCDVDVWGTDNAAPVPPVGPTAEQVQAVVAAIARLKVAFNL